MARYRGRPVEAVQWFPPGDPRHAGPHSAVEILYRSGNVFHAAYLKRPGRAQLTAVGAGTTLQPGDWIVSTRLGDTVIMKPDVFEDLYEPAER